MGLRQKWNITLIDSEGLSGNGKYWTYNIAVAGGTSGGVGGEQLLSVSDDGKVDLYSHDDLSGKQQWYINSNYDEPPTYSIQNVGKDYPYLSTTTDGKKVDLYYKDDESG